MVKKQLFITFLALIVIAYGFAGITNASSAATTTESGQIISGKKNVHDGQEGNKDDGNKGNKDDEQENEKDDGQKCNKEDRKATVTSDTYGKKCGKQEKDKDDGQKCNKDDQSATVTSDTYENPCAELIDAIGNDKEKSTGAIIAKLLLTKYGSLLTDEMKTVLESIKNKDEALSKFADILANNGSLSEAIYTEKEAIKANLENVDSYKKIGMLYEKSGKVGVKLFVNGDEPSTDVAPIIRNDRTLVPFGAISKALKATVSWNPEERSVTVTRGSTTVKLIIDSKTAFVNDKPVPLDVPATIENGRTIVPVGFITKALNATVKWEPTTKSVIIYEKLTP
jgi:hypothetical protein